MEQYISKSALVAEIERLKCKWKNPFCTTACDRIEEIINNLEVKEVNEVDMPVSHSLTEEGVFTFKDGSQAIITKID